MYCAWRIPAHLRCTQCSILLHLMDICFLTCICLWQISQIQTFLFKVVGPGMVSTSPAFVSNSASHPAGPHGQKTGKSGPHCWGRGGSTQFAQQLESAVTAPPLVGSVVWSQPENVNFSITTRDTHKRMMKETLLTRHRSVVEPLMIANDRKTTLQAIHTMSVNQVATSLGRNIVLDDLPQQSTFLKRN